MNLETHTYRARVRHDAGVALVSITTSSYLAALTGIMDAERCPERSILSIERLAPKKSKMPRLGARQQGMLHHLLKLGIWYAGCGWTYGSRLQTVKLLDALVAKGVARKGRQEIDTTGVFRDFYSPIKQGDSDGA